MKAALALAAALIGCAAWLAIPVAADAGRPDLALAGMLATYCGFFGAFMALAWKESGR